MNFAMKKMFMLMAPEDDGGGSGGGEGDKDKDKNKDKEKDKEEDKDLDGDKVDVSKLDPKVQKMIKDLRTENAKHRTDGKKVSDRLTSLESILKKVAGGDTEEETPEEKLAHLSGRAESAEVRSTMLEIALENGISKDNFEYFEFLMGKQLNSLEEGAELSEEDLEEVLKKVKVGAKKGPAQTSPDDDKEKEKNPGKDDEMTVEQFAKLGMMAKSKLFNEKPDTYNSLLKQAKEKRLL
jgi:hypothetical protein